ncbi:MAG: hypothetical protein AB4911_14360 [Oscillochloridaceae bacterium umkhey_bin13]
MINVTTHTSAETTRTGTIAPIHRLGSQTLVFLLLGEIMLILGVLLWVLNTLVPSSTPLAATYDLQPVREAIIARMSGEVLDPLVEVGPGISARTSNLRGFSLNGATYYYFIEGATNFDPLSRGKVDRDQVEVLLRDESGPAVLVIYRVL